MADVKPILAGMFVDDEGGLWVQRVVPSDAPAFYDRFSAEGDYLGSVRLAFRPARGRVWVQHGNIYTWVVDELDVPYVVRGHLCRRLRTTYPARTGPGRSSTPLTGTSPGASR